MNQNSSPQYILQNEKIEKEKKYWLKKLSGDLTRCSFSLPLGNRKQTKKEKNELTYEIGDELFYKLKQLSNNSDLNMCTILLTSLVITLYKYTSNKDIIIGTPIFKQKFEDKIINSVLAIRNKIEEDVIIKELILQVRKSIIEANENQNYPLEKVLYHLGLDDDDYSILGTTFVFENIQNRKYIEHIKSDISFSFLDIDDSIRITAVYNELIYCEEEIQNIIEHLKYCIEYIAKNSHMYLSDFKLITEETRNKVLYEYNGSITNYPETRTVKQIFEEQVETTPDNTALIMGDRKLTYSELNKRANQLAWLLRAKGVSPDKIVGILLENSIEMIISILAVIKAGGAYLPIDPNLPNNRVCYVIKNSGINILINKNSLNSNIEYKGELIDISKAPEKNEKENNLTDITKPNNLLYVIFTSGTTGKPKGVMIEHHNLINYIDWFTKTLSISDDDETVLLSSLAFDLGYTALYSVLTSGGKLHIVPSEGILDYERLTSYICDKKITYIKTTPSLFNMLINSTHINQLNARNSLRLVVLGGEQIKVNDIDQFKRIYEKATIVNHYGPTETTIGSIAKTIDLEDFDRFVENPVIGQPIKNTHAYILDNKLEPVSIGVPGELYISGAGLARGYLNNSKLTHAYFIKNPFVVEEKMYRTGDICKWMKDGSIQFLGRLDNQIKIRGFRVELGEIEYYLEKYPTLKDYAVIASKNEESEYFIAAFVVIENDFNIHNLKDYLSKVLPNYMMPTFFVKVEKIPLTPNGKIDTKALLENDMKLAINTEYISPRNDIEKNVVSIWKEILGFDDQIGIKHNFFELGGHSLSITRLVTRIHKDFSVEIPIMEIFQNPTVENMARLIDEGIKDNHSLIVETAKREYYPLSSAQRRMYVMNKLEGGSIKYNIPFVANIKGDIEYKQFEQAFKNLVQRHEPLRTSFHIEQDDFVQVIHDNIKFKIDHDELGEKTLEEEVMKFIQPFDLETTPLIRVKLIKLASDKHILIIDMHHIISDGISKKILISELFKLYNQIDLHDITIQYKDYAIWQQDALNSEQFKKQEEYWLRKFKGDIPTLNLPTDFPRPVMQSFKGQRIGFELDENITMKLKSLALNNNATLYMVLLAAYNVLLHKYTGQDDIIIGSPIAGRINADIEDMVGMFVNVLAMRNRIVDSETFLTLVQNVRKNALEAYMNQDFQFEELVERMNIRRDTSRNPIFDTMFIQQNIDFSLKKTGNLDIVPYNYDIGTSKYDITLIVNEIHDKLYFNLEYCTDLFRKETMDSFVEHFINLINNIIEYPNQKIYEIEILKVKEKNLLLKEFNLTKKNYVKDCTIHNLFEEQVERTPNHIALTCGTTKLTYAQLNEKANQLACSLKNNGVGPDVLVGIVVNRSCEMVISLLAVLKSGGAYLPIDLELPDERIEYMIKNSNVKHFIVKNKVANRLKLDGYLLDVDSTQNYDDKKSLKNMSHSANLAYVMYTSGSTGSPKGVMVEHRSVVNFINGMRDKVDFTTEKRIMALTTISFDISVLEIYLPLSIGVEIVIATEEQQKDTEMLAKEIADKKINILQITPSRLKLLLNNHSNIEYLSSITDIVIGGENFPIEEYELLRSELDVNIYNAYGPTETTVWSTIKQITSRDDINIGKPISNTKVYILDKNLALQPIGVIGELYIAGDGLARGYHNSHELSNNKFIDNPYENGKKFYRTGDLAKWLPSGDLVFCGRNDDQVKLRGFRVELEEIEQHLHRLDDINEAAVIIKEDKKMNKQLWAYLVTDENIEISIIKEYLSKWLPHYMIPSKYVAIDKMPLNNSGKVDKTCLKRLKKKSIDNDITYMSPQTILELQMVNIWSQYFDKEDIGIQDNIFDLGGNSLTVIKIANDVSVALHRNISVITIFRFPTIQSLCNYLDNEDPLFIDNNKNRKNIIKEGKNRYKKQLTRKVRYRSE